MIKLRSVSMEARWEHTRVTYHVIDEIRKSTSGLAQPMLRFVGFEMLDDVDPFWVPKTEEELEDLGVFGERENVAKRYVDRVRIRKGLLVRGTRGVGRDAEKQKTLKTN